MIQSLAVAFDGTLCLVNQDRLRPIIVDDLSKWETVGFSVQRSKVGKKFAFVHFITVDKLDRLIENLSTIWIGRLRLHANVVRFQREPKTNDGRPKNNNSQPNKTFVGSVKNIGVENRSFASVLNIGKGNPSKVIDSSPAIILDDEYLMERDFSCSLMGKIKDINALPNLYLILSNKGFKNVKLTHLDVEDSESTTISYKRLCVKVKSNVTINDRCRNSSQVSGVYDVAQRV
ncbi:hypothetical protein Tco_0912038 [Tanacetum coccineum]